MKPLHTYTLPASGSQGEFAAQRKYDIHTGIDLYCQQGDQVFAIEDGEVVNVCAFTGPKANLPWWNDTSAVLVEGSSGVILYGEIEPCVSVGMQLKAGDIIGKVLRVLKQDKGKPMDMLHLELYQHGYRGDGEIWTEQRPLMLLDPNILLI